MLEKVARHRARNVQVLKSMQDGNSENVKAKR
jgi:hypothetical protein